MELKPIWDPIQASFSTNKIQSMPTFPSASLKARWRQVLLTIPSDLSLVLQMEISSQRNQS